MNGQPEQDHITACATLRVCFMTMLMGDQLLQPCFLSFAQNSPGYHVFWTAGVLEKSPDVDLGLPP